MSSTRSTEHRSRVKGWRLCGSQIPEVSSRTKIVLTTVLAQSAVRSVKCFANLSPYVNINPWVQKKTQSRARINNRWFLTEHPEHEADLDVGHQNVCRSERELQFGLHLVAIRLFVVARVALDRRRVGDGHRFRLVGRRRRLIKSESGGRQQYQETGVRQWVRQELGGGTSQRAADL